MEMKKISIGVIGLLTFLALWPTVVSGDARPPSPEEIRTDVWLTATCEDATGGIHNLSDVTGVEIVEVLVDGEVMFHYPIKLQAGQTITALVNWAGAGVPVPIAEPHTIVIKTNDDQASVVVGPCGGPQPTMLHLEPDEATNQLPSETTHLFTATVLDQDDEPMPGVGISFSTTLGHFLEDDQYVEISTDESGQAVVTLTSIVPGTAEIRAWIDSNENDVYDEGELTDDLSTKTWTGEGPTIVEVSKTVDAQWALTYTWDISKSVQPDSLALFQGQSHALTYTIETRRDVVSESYTVQGLISVTNVGVNPAHLVKARDCVGYADLSSGSFVTLACQPISINPAISPGETATRNYNLPFTPILTTSTYHNRVEVTISNHYDGEHVFVYTKTFGLPSSPTSRRDATVTLTDEQTVPPGFLVQNNSRRSGQIVHGSSTFIIPKTLTNVSAARGDYALHNTATIIQTDSGIAVSASATVPVTALEPCLRIHKILDGAYTNYTNGDRLLPGTKTPYVHISEIDRTWSTLFCMTIEVENCGNVDLTDVEVTDVVGEQVAWKEKERSGGDPPYRLRLALEDDGFTLGSITWPIGDLLAYDSVYLTLYIKTLQNSDGLYEPTSRDQSIKINTGARVQATATGFDSVATTAGITLTLEPTGDPSISEVSLPYETPWAEAVFTSTPTVTDAWVQKTARNPQSTNGQVFKARDRFQVHRRR